MRIGPYLVPRVDERQHSASSSAAWDPLDILSTGVKHNVWIVLDTSGSMGDDLTGNDNGDPLCTGADDDTCWDPTSIRLDVAKSVLTNLIQDVLVDASGNALVNWGYVNFAVNSRDPDSACELPGIVGQDPQNECVGLDFADLVSPPACGGDDNRATVLENLDAVTDDGWTPNGISVDQISDRIVASGGVSGLLTNQGNFIILLTDGEDTCECDSKIWEDDLAGGVNSSTAYLRSQNGTSAEDTSNSVSDGGESRAYNAGLKGRRAYQRLNPTAADQAGATKVTSSSSVWVSTTRRPSPTGNVTRITWPGRLPGRRACGRIHTAPSLPTTRLISFKPSRTS